MNRLFPVLPFVLPFVALAAPFEIVALVDSLDYAEVFDVETRTGNLQALEYVLSNGVTAVWWRDKGGGLVRYPSREESGPQAEVPFARCRLPNATPVYGRLRLDRPEADAFPPVFAECARRGVSFGIHTTWEENHWLASLTSSWNLGHPQYWCRRRWGVPWSGHCSLAYPEVLRHKLALVDERLAYRPQTVCLDLYRCGGWDPSCEYVRPMLERWRAQTGETAPPSPDDPRWLRLVGEHVEGYLEAFARKCHAAGCAFGVGSYGFDDADDREIRRRKAIDWRRLAAEGFLDYVVVMGVAFDPNDPWKSTERVYRSVMSRRGAAKVYFPVSAYTFQRCCLATYARTGGVTAAEAAGRLTSLARRVGAAGVVLECLDYGNYPPDVMSAIRTAAGKGER